MFKKKPISLENNKFLFDDFCIWKSSNKLMEIKLFSFYFLKLFVAEFFFSVPVYLKKVFIKKVLMRNPNQ